MVTCRAPGWRHETTSPKRVERRLATDCSAPPPTSRSTELGWYSAQWCAATDITLDRVRLVLGSLVILSWSSTHVYVVGSQLIGDLSDHPEGQFLGGLHMTFSAVNANVTIVDSVFRNQARATILRKA